MPKSRLVLEKAICEDVQSGVHKLAGGKRILVRSRSRSTFEERTQKYIETVKAMVISFFNSRIWDNYCSAEYWGLYVTFGFLQLS